MRSVTQPSCHEMSSGNPKMLRGGSGFCRLATLLKAPITKDDVERGGEGFPVPALSQQSDPKINTATRAGNAVYALGQASWTSNRKYQTDIVLRLIHSVSKGLDISRTRLKCVPSWPGDILYDKSRR